MLGCSSIGRASVFGTEGRRFESYHPSHFYRWISHTAWTYLNSRIQLKVG